MKMNMKIELHKMLGLSIEQIDNISDDIVDVFEKNRSLREVVEFVNEHYDSKSVIAGMVLDTILINVLYDETINE